MTELKSAAVRTSAIGLASRFTARPLTTKGSSSGSAPRSERISCPAILPEIPRSKSSIARQTLYARAAPVGDGLDDNIPGQSILAQQHALADRCAARRLDPPILDANLPGLDRQRRETPRPVKARRPQPLVEAHPRRRGRVSRCQPHDPSMRPWRLRRHGLRRAGPTRPDCGRFDPCSATA